MSLLADLLSKTKNREPSGGKEIPPTLLRAQETGSTSSKLKRRFVIMSVVALAAIVAGIFLPSQLKRLSILLPSKTAVTASQPNKAPLPPRVSPASAPEQVMEEAQKLLTATQQINTAAPVDTNKQGAEPAAAQVPAPGQNTPVKSVAPDTDSRKRSSDSAASKKTKTSKALPKRTQQKAPVTQAKAVSPPAASAAKSSGAASVKVDTNARGALLYAARSAEQSGDWRGALASYRAALDIDPENYRIMSNSAAAYNKLGMYADAEREARRALARKPDFVPALINAAIACSSQGYNNDALRFFTAAAAAEPGNRSLAINLGIMQERTGNLDEALATYRKAAATGDPQALSGMGRINEQKGNKSEAIAAYKAIISQKDINPSFKREIKERLLRLEE